MMITDRECCLCKAGLEAKIDSNAEQAALAVEVAAKIAEQSLKALRREIRIAVGVSTALIGTFITVLGLLLGQGVI